MVTQKPIALIKTHKAHQYSHRNSLYIKKLKSKFSKDNSYAHSDRLA